MVTFDKPLDNPRIPVRAIVIALSLFAVQLLAIGLIFKHSINFTCLENWPPRACLTASGALVSVYCVAGAIMLLGMLSRGPLVRLCRFAGERSWPLLINAAGVVIALIPVTLLTEGAGPSVILPAFSFWIVGMGLLISGLALYLAPIRLWGEYLASQWQSLVPAVVVGAAVPSLSTLIRPIWQLDAIAGVTFDAVVWLVSAVGYDIIARPETKVIGADDFFVAVAPACSGVEGLLLVTFFVTLYLSIFRKELRFPHAFLLYPIGLIASALFNVVRISVLLIIGIEGNDELAVGGFHSHAGWLLFTVIALGIVGLARSVPALQLASSGGAQSEHTRSELLPLFQDPMAARILPFAVFMFSALLASTLATLPAAIYPARALLMMAVLAMFWQIYVRLPWRVDPVAVAVGAAIGLMWIAIPVTAEDGPPPYGTATGLFLVGWFVMRGIGTIVLVPIIEELFFRDYLQKKLRLGTGPAWTVVAIVASAVLFAALHGRWLEAFVAGLAFSWLMHRRDNVSDPIIAHMVANAIVFGIALATGNLAII